MIPEGCFPVYSQIRSDAYHAGICQIFIYIKSFWQWKFYSASRSHTDHKTIFTRFGCWILTVTVSKNTVAHADIFLWNTPLLLQLFSFLGVKNFSCTVNPAGVHAESMCGIHEISHHKTSVFHTGAHFAVGKDNDHSWGAVERI